MKVTMKTTHTNSGLAVVLLLTLSGCGGGSSAPAPLPDPLPHRDAYAITDVGPVLYSSIGYYTENGGIGFAALNNQGAVAHEYGGAAGYWQNGKDAHIGSIGGSLATAFGINDNGQVAGFSETTQQYYSPSDVNKQYPVTVSHAFLWQNGSFTNLGALPLVASADDPSFTAPPSSFAMAVNNAGQVVGSSQEPTFPHAFLWQQGKMTDLDTGLYSGSSAYGLNNAGQIVGVNGGHAALWQNGNYTDLGTLPNQQGSVAVAINSKGQAVGSSMPANPTVSLGQMGQRAVLWQNGQIQDLGTLGGPSGRTFSINSMGQIVGQADTTTTYPQPSNGPVIANSNKAVATPPNPGPPRYIPHAFLYSAGTLTDLNTLIAAKTGWVLDQANSINDKGQIVGFGSYKNAEHYFLLTPR